MKSVIQQNSIIFDTNYSGLLLRDYRVKNKMSQMDLEIETGLSFGSVSRIENGKLNPTKETLYKIIKALRLNINEAIQVLEIEKFVKLSND